MARWVGFAVIALLSGCSSTGMMYAHRDTLGIDMSTGADATKPFSLTLGQANHMATYVPVAVPDGNLPVGSAAAVVSSTLVQGLVASDRQAILKAISQSQGPIADMFSVYSTFSTKTQGAAGSLAMDRGNKFATGLAAQALAKSDQARTCLALEQLYEANKGDATKAADIRATIKATCVAP